MEDNNEPIKKKHRKKYIDSDGKHPIGPLNKFYDDPRDFAMIDWGYDLYWEEN